MKYRYDISKGIQKVKTKTELSVQSIVVGIIGVTVAIAVPLAAHAANGNGPAPNWHVGYYNPGGRALSMAQAMNSLSGLASFNFTDGPNTALLITDQGSQKDSLLGNLSGNTTMSATYNIDNATGAFTYYGEPDGCGTPASARLFFETSSAGGFDETHYWWSHPGSAILKSGPASLTSDLNGSSWSDFYGHYGSDSTYAPGFQAALSNVTGIGISFGGGCFFENGVGTSNGSGTFTLNSFDVTTP